MPLVFIYLFMSFLTFLGRKALENNLKSKQDDLKPGDSDIEKLEERLALGLLLQGKLIVHLIFAQHI